MLGVLLLAGCNSGWPPQTIWPFENYDDGSVLTPVKRIEYFKTVEENAAAASPQEQAQTSQYLSTALAAEEDPLVRIQIVRALAVYPTPAAGEALMTALKDTDLKRGGRMAPNRDVREAACVAWGRRGGPQAVVALESVLREENDLDVRIAATRALGNIREPGAAQALTLALDDRDVAIQRRAMESLKTTTGKDYGDDVNAWRMALRGETVPEVERSMADRVRDYFFR